MENYSHPDISDILQVEGISSIKPGEKALSINFILNSSSACK